MLKVKGAKMQVYKKIICIVAVLIMSALSFLSFNIFESSTSKAAVTTWNQQTGTQQIQYLPTDSEGYYKITSPHQLAWLSYKPISAGANVKVRLYADIDLGSYYWVPMYFDGIFDGQNYKINGLKIDATSYDQIGLFSKMDYGTAIKDVVFNTVTITGLKDGDKAGVVAGYIEGTGAVDASVKNVIIQKATATYSGNNTGTLYFGGIGGFSYGAVIKNCLVYIAVYNANTAYPKNLYIGGIVGEANNTQISVCSFELLDTAAPYITAYGSGECYGGGIVGSLDYKNSKSTTTISKCYNTGAISVGNTTSAIGYAGGIAGAVKYGSVDNCFNSASVTANAKETTGASTSIGTFNLGARIQMGEDGIYLCNCHTVNNGAKGDYKNTKGDSSYKLVKVDACAGGIVGKLYDSTSVSYCYSNGITTSLGKAYNRYTFQFKYYFQNPLGVHHFDYAVASDYVNNGYYTVGKIVGQRNTGTISYCHAPTSSNQIMCYLDNNKTTHITVRNPRVTFIASLGSDAYILSKASNNKYIIGQTNAVESTLDEKHSYTMIKPTGYTTETLASTNISDIITENSTVWFSDSNINGGKPMIKNFYWKYSATEPK